MGQWDGFGMAVGAGVGDTEATGAAVGADTVGSEVTGESVGAVVGAVSDGLEVGLLVAQPAAVS